MTKKEIIKALIKGKKITHRTFNDVQWIKLYKKQSTHYINQSGKVTQALEFWLNRTDEKWEDGWSIKDS